MAKFTAASVANASITAPRLTRKLCFITCILTGYTNALKFYDATALPLFGSIAARLTIYFSVTYTTLRGNWLRNSIFWKTFYSFRDHLFRTHFRTANLAHPGKSETPAPVP